MTSSGTNPQLQNRTTIVSSVEETIGYLFKNQALLWEAVQAPGQWNQIYQQRTITNDENKRLALISYD